MKLQRLVNKAIVFCFYALFFFTPLILIPVTSEIFEFNKMLFVYFLSVLVLCLWAIKSVIENSFTFSKTPLFYPLLIFLFSQILATIISIDPHTSVFGYYSRFNGGLLSLLSYILLFFGFASLMDKEKTLNCLKSLLFSGLLVSLYGIGEYFGIDKNFWVQDVQERVFSTLGQPNWLASWLSILSPISFFFFFKSFSKQGFFKKYGYLLISIVFFACLVFTKSRSGFLSFAVVGLFTFLNVFIYKKEFKKPLILLGTSFFLIALVFGTPYTPKLGSLFTTNQEKVIEQEPSEEMSQAPLLISKSTDIRKVVWKGALDIFKNHPVLGTGVETFAYSYYQYRPREHNDLSEWDFLYNKAHNEFLNYAANTGSIGLLAYLALCLFIIIFLFKSFLKEKDFLFFSLFLGIIGFLISSFFGFSVVCTNSLFFLIPAFGFALLKEENSLSENGLSNLSTANKIAILGVFVLFVFGCSLVFKMFKADTLFAQAEGLVEANYYERAFTNLSKAIDLRPNEPFYHNSLSYSSAGVALLLQESDNASQSADFIDFAIIESDKALSISPYHINFWKKRARMFYLLSEIDSKYLDSSLEALMTASILAPTDAKIEYNIAILENKLGDQEKAIESLNKAITLKPNYIDSYYLLGLILEEQGKLKEANQAFENVLKINPNHTQALEKLGK